MPDPSWFEESRKPSQPRQPKPGDHVWALRKNGHQIDCELRAHGEPYGCEVQILVDGDLRQGQRYVTHEAAMQEAERRRRRLINEGWMSPDVGPDSNK